MGQTHLVPRLFRHSLWMDAALLAMVLLASLAFVGTNDIVFADEGSYIIQTTHLRNGDGWLIEHPAPELDPEFEAYPLHLADYGSRGAAAYLRHWAYPLLLVLASTVGGLTAMFFLSVVGTLLAAFLTGLVAERLRRGAGSYAFWITGLASPLFFDSLLVQAHTLGAAAVAALAVSIGSGRQSRKLLVLVPPAVAGVMLLRTEGRFIIVGYLVALCALAFRRRSRSPLETAVVIFVAAVVTYAVESKYAQSVIGETRRSLGDFYPQASFFVARWRAFTATWLRLPEGRPLGVAALFASSVLVFVAALSIRLRRALSPHVLLAIAGLLAIGGSIYTQGVVIPGLLPAFPFFGVLILLRKVDFEDDRVFVLLVAAAVFATGVLGTQYEQGGTFEWGGRYFAVGLPLVVPLIAICGHRYLHEQMPKVRRTAVAGVLAIAIGFNFAGAAYLRRAHIDDRRLVSEVRSAAASTGVERPIVITWYGGAAKLAYPVYQKTRWLTPSIRHVDRYLTRAAKTGEPFVYIEADVKESELPRGVCIESKRGTIYAIYVLAQCTRR